MKLDRNTNTDARGKYALLNLRHLYEIRDKPRTADDLIEIEQAMDALCRRGILTFGNESPGDQFFVVKYKDKFAVGALEGYAAAIEKEYPSASEPESDMREFRAEMLREACIAASVGTRLPD